MSVILLKVICLLFGVSNSTFIPSDLKLGAISLRIEESLALRRGIAGKVVQEMLGHSNYSTTMDIYSHVDPDMHKEASKQMNEALGG